MYPEVIFSTREVCILACALNSSTTILGKVLSMTSIVLRKSQQGVNRLLVILMALDLDDHLLQSKDNLFAALFRHLIRHVIPSTLSVLAATLLVLLWGVLFNTVAKILSAGAKATDGINTIGSAIALILSSTIRGVAVIARAIGISSLVGVLSNLPDFVAIQRFTLVESIAELSLYIVAGKVRGFVPLVIWGWVINLAQLVFAGLNLHGNLGSRITSDVSEKDDSIIQEFAELAINDVSTWCS